MSGMSGLKGVHTRAQFAAWLDERRVASNGTYRSLGADSDNPPSTVRDWCRGNVLPARGQDDRFRKLLAVMGVDDPEPAMATLIRLRGRGTSVDSPYPGLDAFRSNDAGWYFGRAGLVEDTVERFGRLLVEPGSTRVLWVVGPSGAGKSSLLHAGLVPRLEAKGYMVTATTPGENPLFRLADAIADHVGLSASDITDALAIDADQWAVSLGRTSPGATELVVVLDQFEELGQGCDAAEREHLVAALHALTSPHSTVGCAVLTGLRVDFYPAMTADPVLARSLQDAQVLVGPMHRGQLRDAILEPASRAGFQVEDELVTVILDDFIPAGALRDAHDPGALPLMAHALRETWNRARRRQLTLRDYTAAGGIRGAIEGTAQRIYEDAGASDREVIRQVFVRLVHLQSDGIATRRQVAFAELQALDDCAKVEPAGHASPFGVGRGTAPTIVERFVDARLLTVTETTVEITHESLLSAWPRLTGWIDEDREALRVQRGITDATTAWRSGGGDPSLLATGSRLEAMSAWVNESERKASPLRLNQDERDYLTASSEAAVAAESSRRRRTRRLRSLAATATVCALLAGSFALLLSRARTDAITARDQAMSRQLAVSAEHLRSSDPTLAAQLAVAGYDIADTSEARSAVLGTASVPSATRYLGGPGSTALSLSPRGKVVAASNSDDGTVQLFTRSDNRLTRSGVIDLTSEDLEIYALAVTPDDQTVIVGDTEASITIWDVTDPAHPERVADVSGPTGPIQALALDKTGTELAAVGQGDGAFRWAIEDPTTPRPLPTLPAPDITWSVSYQARGELVAVGLETGEVHLWDLKGEEPARVAIIPTRDGSTYDVAFSPDGRTLAAGSSGGALQVWGVGDPTKPERIDIVDDMFESWVNTVAFSPDGRWLAAGSSDLDLRVWDTVSWSAVQSLAHPAALTQAVFTADGDALLTAATDGTTRVWALPASLPVSVPGRVWGVTYTKDGDRFAAFSGEQARIWDADDLHSEPIAQLGKPAGTSNELSGGSALSADGSLLAMGTQAGTVYLVDLGRPGTPDLLAELDAGEAGLVEVVAFSGDGRHLAAGGGSTDIRVWDITDPASPQTTTTLTAPAETVLNLAWSPRDPYLAATSADNHVYLYDLTQPNDPSLLTRLGGFDSEAYAAAFTPDGEVLATGGSDTFVLLWDISRPSSPTRIGRALRGPTARIFDLEFDTRGERLAAAVTDGTAWVWDVDGKLSNPKQLAVLGPVDAPLAAVQFSLGADVLAAAGGDGRVRLWPTSTESVIESVCKSVGDRITPTEWAAYLPDTPYTPPCEPA